MKNIFILFSLLSISIFSLAQNPLLIPPTLTGTSINLTLQNGTHQFYPPTNTTTMGVNGNILAPTLILNQGDFVNFTVNNQISDTTTIHWHGLHVAPENDGGPHTYIVPNGTWSPSFTIMDKAATYWYHPHLHHKTNKHVSKGIAGFIIVKDADESALTLPRTYGVDDFPLVMQTKEFDTNKEILYGTNSDNVAMVNATIDAYQNVGAQVVRCRLLNGSAMRVFNVGLSNNQNFSQIASDGGLLSAPFQTNRLLLGPGERAEILIDFSALNGQSIYLKSFASELPNGFYGAANPGMGAGMTLTGYNPNPLNGADFNLLKFNVAAATAGAVTTIPTALVTVTPIPTANANITRALTLNPSVMGPNQLNSPFTINNTSFDMMVMNYTIPLDNTEIWTIQNMSGIAHPFHIHDIQFYVYEKGGVAPPINEQGRKDVVLIAPMQTVKLITKFDDFTHPTIPYMYHCHMLIHEDDGMMGQFLVTQDPSGVNDIDNKYGISIYPNPSTGMIKVNNPKNINIQSASLMDMTGRVTKLQLKQNLFVDLNHYAKGLYAITLQVNNEYFITKLVIR